MLELLLGAVIFISWMMITTYAYLLWNCGPIAITNKPVHADLASETDNKDYDAYRPVLRSLNLSDYSFIYYNWQTAGDMKQLRYFLIFNHVQKKLEPL